MAHGGRPTRVFVAIGGIGPAGVDEVAAHSDVRLDQ